MALRKPPPNDDQLELFSAIFTDIASRDAQDTMEFPFLSLAKKPRFKPIKFKSPKGVEVIVSGGEPHGIANIYDYDLIIWLLSQIRHAIDRGEDVSRKVRFSRRSYLKDVRRATGGKDYARLKKTIARLKNTTVTTTIRSERNRTIMFSWFEFADIEGDKKGAFCDAVVVLPEWLFETACDKRRILTINRSYFLLTGGIERWLYRIIRKGAGRTKWEWTFRTLYSRSGTTQTYKDFAFEMRKVARRGTLLDYSLSLDTKNGDELLKANRTEASDTTIEPESKPTVAVNFLHLRTETFEKAKAVALGHDVYVLYEWWKEYNAGKEKELRKKDAAFIAFCKTHARKNPIPAR